MYQAPELAPCDKPDWRVAVTFSLRAFLIGGLVPHAKDGCSDARSSSG
jgi:hypothetical protein